MPLLKQLFINLQRNGDIIDLVIFINLVSASVYLTAFESLNESIMLLISQGYFGVTKKELITPVGAVAFISSASTWGKGSRLFFPYVGKVCIEIFRNSSRISQHVTCLVLSWFMSICLEGFKFTSSFTIFHILPLLLLLSIINAL